MCESKKGKSAHAYVGDITGLVPGHNNERNVTMKRIK